MAPFTRIDDERGAIALADLLNGNARRRPVVVVTIPSARADPWIEVEEIAREAGPLADVFLMPTGAFTWEFSHRMADGTQVYGGAGRVYPVGHEWTTDLSRSPLRFAFDADEGRRATQHLISDMLRMAAAAGLLRAIPTKRLTKVDGEVRWIVAGRALVQVDGDLSAAIAEELTIDEVPINRIVTVGQRVRGSLDSETKRLDITQSLRAAPEALSSYAEGDVVLAKVASVRNGKAELVLFPRTSTPAVTVPVLRADVTSNPADDLRTLMTIGEVVAARIVETGPTWRLTLKDVDDDEPVVVAPPLLDGGPPWLIDEPEAEPSDPVPRNGPPAPKMPSPSTMSLEPEREAQPNDAPSPRPGARPSPMMLDRSRSRAQDVSTMLSGPVADAAPPPTTPAIPASPSPTNSMRQLLLKVDALNGQLRILEGQTAALRTELDAGVDERAQLRYLMDQADRRANKAEHDLKAARARLRKASGGRAPRSAEVASPRFADPEEGFRYLVLTKWATRTLPSEQADRPIRPYTLGPRFLDSLEHLEGISAEKVADVVFEIVTGIAPRIAGREVHHLRTGTGGDDPVRRRPDGAIAWRASLQVNTPSARRIHYWELGDGGVELARAATHDDFDI